MAPLARHIRRLVLVTSNPTLLTRASFRTDLGGKDINIMAWRSSGISNEDLIDQLSRNGLIADERVKAAFLKVCIAHLPCLVNTPRARTSPACPESI